MNPPKLELPINGDNRIFWLRAIYTLGVGTAFGVLMTAISWYGFIIPSNERMDRTEIRQEKLVDSIIQTNSSLTDSNTQNADTLRKMEQTLNASSAVVLQAVQSNGEVLRATVEMEAQAFKLSQSQCEKIDAIKQIMDDATKLMVPVAAQRELQLQKLDELIQAVKGKPNP